MSEEHVVYMLKCGDDSIYTGYTTDVARRLEEHRNGDGAKYTRGRTPLELVYTESYASRSEALAREAALKQMTRNEKLALVDR